MSLNYIRTMPKIRKPVYFYVCSRCGHEWYPRGTEQPKTCPKCRSPYWDSPRKNKKKEGKK